MVLFCDTIDFFIEMAENKEESNEISMRKISAKIFERRSERICII
jgi:hypothetical protein